MKSGRWLLILLVDCTTTTWHSIEPPQIDGEHVLVVTDTNAYEMDASHIDGKVEGKPTRAWNTNECELDDANASPTDLAELCNWKPIAAPRSVRIDDSSIVDVHAPRQELRTGAILAGVLIGFLGGALVYEGVIAYSLRNTK